MGSPNFKTFGLALNLASWPFESEQEIGSADYEADEFCHNENVQWLHSRVLELIDDMRPMQFYRVLVESGYHEGFQVMLENDVPSEIMVRDWNEYHELYDRDGYRLDDMGCFTFARRNARNITGHSLLEAEARECRYAQRYLIKMGRELGLGEVHGETWTSSVGQIETELPRGGCFVTRRDGRNWYEYW